MIEVFSRRQTVDMVLRLAALPEEPLKNMLLKRGISPESIDETLAVLLDNGTPFSADEVIKDAFRPKERYPTPFPIGRYGDGFMPVYYSALEDETCEAELRYHLNKSLVSTRYFTMVSCEFRGQVLVLLGHEGEIQDLVSETTSGYPFCQKLSREARATVEGLYAPSARRQGGTCVPVFTQDALSNGRQTYRCRFARGREGSVKLERL